MAKKSSPSSACLTVNRLIALQSSFLGSCEICMKSCRLMLWRGECACLPATLIAPSKVYSATRQLSLWKGYASMRQSDAFLFRSEPSIPLLPPLASQMHKRFGAHSNGDLVQNRAATSRPSLQVWPLPLTEKQPLRRWRPARNREGLNNPVGEQTLLSRRLGS